MRALEQGEDSVDGLADFGTRGREAELLGGDGGNLVLGQREFFLDDLLYRVGNLDGGNLRDGAGRGGTVAVEVLGTLFVQPIAADAVHPKIRN